MVNEASTFWSGLFQDNEVLSMQACCPTHCFLALPGCPLPLVGSLSNPYRPTSPTRDFTAGHDAQSKVQGSPFGLSTGYGVNEYGGKAGRCKALASQRDGDAIASEQTQS